MENAFYSNLLLLAAVARKSFEERCEAMQLPLRKPGHLPPAVQVPDKIWQAGGLLGHFWLSSWNLGITLEALVT